MKQILRKFNGEMYSCDFFTSNREEADSKRKEYKRAERKARIVIFDELGKKVFGVFNCANKNI